MAWKSVKITRSRSSEMFDGSRGPNPFKTRAHYIMLIVFVIGIVAIIAIGIFIGIDKANSEKAMKEPEGESTKPAATTTTVAGGSTPAATTLAATTTTTPAATSTTTDGLTILQKLKKVLADPDRVLVSNFTNWDGTTTLSQVYRVSPIDVDEVQALVRVAQQVNLKLRPVGSSLSYADLFPDEGQILLETQLLTTRENGETITLNDTSQGDFGFPTVSMAAGIQTGELVDFLNDNNLQVASLVSTRDTQISGIISTASHSLRLTAATASDQVVGLKYVDGEGNTHSVNSNTPDDLQRIRCCLGLCGIIYDVTMKTEPSVNLKLVQNFTLSGYELIKDQSRLTSMLRNNYAMEMFYAPLTSMSDEDWASYQSTGKVPDTVDPWEDLWWTREMEQILETDNNQTRRRRKRSADNVSPLLSGIVPGSLLEDMNTTTATPPIYTDLLLHKYAYEYALLLVQGDPISYGSYLDLAVHLLSTELQKTKSVSFVIPDTEDLDAASTAMQIVFDTLQGYWSQGQCPILTIDLRWIAVSPDCLLCPESYSDGTNSVLSLELAGASYKPNFIQFAGQVLEKLQLQWPNVRVHWAKFYEDMEGITTFMHDSMSDQLNMMSTPTVNGTVAFWDIFTSDLLSSIINNNK